MGSFSLSEIPRIIDSKKTLSDVMNTLEAMMGRTLSGTDLVTVLTLYDEYDFTEERIMELYRYCIDLKKTSPNYVLKVAGTWKEKNIHHSTELSSVEISSDNLPEIMPAIYDVFELKDRQTTEQELTYVNKWLYEWRVEELLILEACKKTVQSINSPSFAYADRIISNWTDKGILTREALLQSEQENHYSSSTSKKDSFAGFKQRKYDYNELEKEAFGE